jgi:uncharacterized protein YcbK (DUF882 family)
MPEKTYNQATMKEKILHNVTTSEVAVIASRRKFLKNMFCGSVLLLGGTGVAGATAKHIAHASPQKNSKVKTAGKHESVHSAKIKDKSKHGHELAHNAKQKDIKNHKQAEIHTAKHHEEIKNRHGKLLSTKHQEVTSRHHEHIQVAEHRQIQNHKQSVFRFNQPHENLIPEHAFVQNEEYNEDNELFSHKYKVIQRPAFNRFSNLTHKALALENNNTGEMIKLTYFEQDRYISDALAEINYLLRDHQTDEIHTVDTGLLDQLHDLQLTLGINKPFNVVCGYRSPNTNASMRRHSRGVARHSYHMEGKAVDIRIAGLSTREIRNAALSMGRGGVGYYPGNNFVHIDTGPIRTW